MKRLIPINTTSTQTKPTDTVQNETTDCNSNVSAQNVKNTNKNVSSKHVTTNETVSSNTAISNSNKNARTVETDTKATNIKQTEVEKQKKKSTGECSPVDEKELETIRKNLKYAVSDDSFDYLESQADKLNETNNLGEKINIYSKIQEYAKNIEEEIEKIAEIIDKLDTDAVTEEITKRMDMTDETSDISDDIVNIEKMTEELKGEDVMQIKLIHYQKIIEKIKFCKAKCDSSKMKIAKCN